MKLPILLQLPILAIALVASPAAAEEVIDIGDRRELFVDEALIESRDKVRLVMHRPTDEGEVLAFDKPWEGPFCGYATVIRDGSWRRRTPSSTFRTS